MKSSQAKLPAGSPAFPALEAALRALGYRYHIHPSSRSPYISITGDWEAFLGARSAKFRRSCRHKLNRMHHNHAVEVEEIRDWERFAAVYEDIQMVCSRSWKAARGLALTSRPERIQFYRELARPAAARGWLSVWTLRIEGQMVAYEYHLCVDGINHGLLSSFDQEFADLSPGAVLDYHVVKQLFAEGRVGYDQGGGDTFYKRRWTELAQEQVDLVAFPPGWRGNLAEMLEYRLVTQLRRGRAKLLPRYRGSGTGPRYLAVRERFSWGGSEESSYGRDSDE